MGTYVVLVNERPESRAALDWALQTVTQFPGSTEAELHVVLGPSTDIPGGPRYVSPALNDDVTGQLRDSGVTHEVHSGAKDPVESIIALAGDVNADLVVIGMQRRSSTLKLIVGSYARDILVDAPCPVVAVKE
jgi:nucleotide-binding universal stress UspA family protein